MEERRMSRFHMCDVCGIIMERRDFATDALCRDCFGQVSEGENADSAYWSTTAGDSDATAHSSLQ